MACAASSNIVMGLLWFRTVLTMLSAAPLALGISSTCPDDGFQISCMVDPCTTNICKAFPQASCEPCYSSSCPCCAIFSVNGEEVDCEAPTDAMCNTPCTNDYKICADGSTLYRYQELGCQFPGCPPCSHEQCCGLDTGFGGVSACDCLMDPDTYCPYNCDAGMNEELITKCACADLTNEVSTFGDCLTPLGVAIVNGECVMVSGCSLPQGLELYSSIEECQSTCNLEPCPEDVKHCACGTSLIRLPQLGCQFPLCPEDDAIQNVCNEGESQCECDLSDVFFGLCEMVLGYGVVGGSCKEISGCPSDLPEQVQLFATYDECSMECPSTLCPHGAMVQCQGESCTSEMCQRNKAAACVECEEGPCDTLAYVNDTILSQIQCNCGCGDVNDDGILNVLDVTASFPLVKLAKNKLDSDSDIITSVCGEQEVDLNKDGLANILDLVAMLTIIKGGASPLCSA